MEWGGVWDLTPWPITGNAYFDWFFTLVGAFGLMAFVIQAICRVLARS
jgi:hypothetical protein